MIFSGQLTEGTVWEMGFGMTIYMPSHTLDTVTAYDTFSSINSKMEDYKNKAHFDQGSPLFTF